MHRWQSAAAKLVADDVGPLQEGPSGTALPITLDNGDRGEAK